MTEEVYGHIYDSLKQTAMKKLDMLVKNEHIRSVLRLLAVNFATFAKVN
jgi:hypothetical protein